MNRLIVAIAVSLALAFVTTTTLTFAVEPEEIVEDRPRDLKLTLTPNRPVQKALADIRFAQVHRDGDSVVFEATLSATVPQVVTGGYFDMTWDIDARSDWRLAASLENGINATLVANETRSGTSTFDGSFPGTIEVDGDTIRIVFQPKAIAGFPDGFRWKLTTRLNMRASEPNVGVVYDYAPDGRLGNYHL